MEADDKEKRRRERERGELLSVFQKREEERRKR